MYCIDTLKEFTKNKGGLCKVMKKSGGGEGGDVEICFFRNLYNFFPNKNI